jgi:hypothetical protein
MKPPRWLASPLAGTAAVLAGLALLAVPLRKLTSGGATAPPAPAAIQTASSRDMPAVLRVRLLAPAKRLTVQSADGKILLEKQNLTAGVSEHDALIAMADGGLDLLVQADFSGDLETAVFLTLMPEGFEEQTRYALGKVRIDEPLRYDWPSH